MRPAVATFVALRATAIAHHEVGAGAADAPPSPGVGRGEICHRRRFPRRYAPPHHLAAWNSLVARPRARWRRRDPRSRHVYLGPRRRDARWQRARPQGAHDSQVPVRRPAFATRRVRLSFKSRQGTARFVLAARARRRRRRSPPNGSGERRRTCMPRARRPGAALDVRARRSGGRRRTRPIHTESVGSASLPSSRSSARVARRPPLRGRGRGRRWRHPRGDAGDAGAAACRRGGGGRRQGVAQRRAHNTSERGSWPGAWRCAIVQGRAIGEECGSGRTRARACDATPAVRMCTKLRTCSTRTRRGACPTA